MNITDVAVKVKRKRGDVREDGMVFWQLDGKKQEVWYAPEFYASKMERVKAYLKNYQEKHKEKLKGYLAGYYQENRERLDVKNSAWAKSNKERAKSFRKKWIHNNREKLNTNRAANARRRRKEDPVFAMQQVARSRLRSAFDSKRIKKNSKTSEMVGCSWEHLKAHIESTFKHGMTWQNRHLWEVDHITPLASARTYEDIKHLSHWTNLQALWKEENRAKADKMPNEA